MPGGLLIHTEASHGWGGQEIRTLRECRWLRDEGFEIHLAAPAEARISTRFADQGFPVHAVPFTKSTQLADIRALLGLIRKLGPRAVCTHSNIDSRVALLAARLAGVPGRIRYRHVSIPVRNNLWNRYLYRRAATRIVTTAESIAVPLRQTFSLPAGRVRTIFTGVDLPSALPTRDEARLALAGQLGLPATTRFIGQVSVLRGWKGHRDLMPAFDRLAASHPQHHLVMVGGGPGERYLPPAAAKLGCEARIHFVGHREDPWPFFLAFDAAILASREGEGVPQSGIQAMLARTPFIGTRVGGIPEIIDDRRSGLLVDPGQPDQIAAALREILDGALPVEALTRRAFDWARTHASVQTMGEAILEILQ